MNIQNAAKIIDHVVAYTKPRWDEWMNQSFYDLNENFIPGGYEQGGFNTTAFFRVLKKNNIGSIAKVGSILEDYEGPTKYIREEQGSLKSPFYENLENGHYGECGKKFYLSVYDFLNKKLGNPGGFFWSKLWQMLLGCRHLKENYNSSFQYYLKKKFCDFKNITNIEDKDFFETSEEEWNQFLKTYPWDELHGIGENVFDYLVRNIKEFTFNNYSFKVDSANIYFFQVTGISRLREVKNKQDFLDLIEKLPLQNGFTPREINTGVYTYCAQTEKENFGFCRDPRKCKECGVVEVCERRF